MSDQDVEQITKKMKSIGLSVPTAVYEEIVKRAAGGSIGGWCRGVIEEHLKPCPEPEGIMISREELVKYQEASAKMSLQPKPEVVDAIVERPLKYQYGTKVPTVKS